MVVRDRHRRTGVNMIGIRDRDRVSTTNVCSSATGTRTRVARVRAEYPNQLDYSGDDAGWLQESRLFDLGRTRARKLCEWLEAAVLHIGLEPAIYGA